jgi:hypothetical protein
MRRLIFLLAFGVLVTAVGVQSVAAKNDLNLTITPAVSQVKPGALWHATLKYTDAVTGKPATNIDSSQVMLKNTETGKIRYADAYSYGYPGTFKTMLRFPTSGIWTLTINDGGPYAWDYESAPFRVGGGGSGFPVIPLVVGIAGALLLASAALLLYRRRTSLGSVTAPTRA